MDPTLDDINAALAAKSGKGSSPTIEDINRAIAAKRPEDTTALRSFTDNLANTASLGYAPQIVGKITQWLSPSKEELTKDIRPDLAPRVDTGNYDPYLQGRDDTLKTLSAEQEQHPTASLAGALSGALGSAIVTPGMSVAKSIPGAVAKGAAMGAGYGLLSNPGDAQGKVDTFQTDDRMHNALKGAVIGGVTSGVAQGASKLLKKLSGSPEALQEAANAQAVKATGANLKELRALDGQNKIDALGQYALDNGIVKAGDTINDVAEKAQIIKKDAGSRLQSIYNKAKAALPEDVEIPDGIGFNPARDKDHILQTISEKLKGTEGKQSAVNRIGNYLDELTTDYGNRVLDPKTTNEIEAKISHNIDFSRNPLNAQPEAEKAFKVMRKFVSDRVDNHVEYLGHAIGDHDLADKLASANKDYGYSSQIVKMAKDRAARILNNHRLSLTDTVAASGGGIAGAVVGSQMEHEGGKGAMLGMLAAGVLHHYGKSYGDAALASMMNTAAKAAAHGPAQLGAVASKLATPAVANTAARTATQYSTVNGENENVNGYSEGGTVPNPQPVTTNQGVLDAFHLGSSHPQQAVVKARGYSDGGTVKLTKEEQMIHDNWRQLMNGKTEEQENADFRKAEAEYKQPVVYLPNYAEGGTVPPAPWWNPRGSSIAQGITKAGMGHAQGGMIPGDSPQNDTVLGALSPGEVVLPRSVTQSPDAPQKAKEFMANEMDPQMVAQAQTPPQKQMIDHEKGPDKWAFDGFQNLLQHAPDDMKEWLHENKGVMLLDPKAKNLLITASSFKPGSKPLDDVISHLQTRFEGKK